MDTQKLADEIGNLSVLQIVDLTKTLEDKWGVKAAPPPVLGPVSDDDLIPGFLPEATEFTVVLSEAGSKKLDVIRAVRDLTGFGLKEAKDLVDNAPRHLKEGIAKAEAEEMKVKLEAMGAKIELVPS